MKTKNIKLVATGLVLALLCFTTSCKKKTQETTQDSDTTEASDHNTAENTSSDIISIGSQASDNSSGSLTSYRGTSDENALSFCATVKRDTIHHVDSVIFNNSTCLDGRVRNGILIFNYSASTNGAKHYRDPGFSCVVSSNGYVVDGNQINIISKSITNTTPVGFNPSTTNLTWNIAGHIQIVKSEGGTIDFNCTRIKTLLNTSDANVYHGAATAISWGLARVGFTGNATGTTAQGKTFTANTTSQIIRDFGGCSVGGRHPFIQGDLDFTPSGKLTRHIDFGNGSCDLNATVTINNKVYNITLK